MSQKYNKKTQRAWAFYDWANSVYSLVIGTAIFPIFYNAVTTEERNGELYDRVSFFEWEFVNTQLYSYVVAASLIVVILVSPILSGVADYTGRKKRFLQLACYLGSTACISLYFFNIDYLELSMLSIFLASIGFWISILFYNSFLPEVAPPEEQDRLSAKGFAWGYVGSVLLLLINLGMIQGIDPSLTRWSFVLVGLWWMGFAQITFRRLPLNPHGKKPDPEVWRKGFRELKKVWMEMKELTFLRRYLIAFFVFSMSVQTIMLMAQFFGMKEVFVISDPSGVGHGVFPPLVQSSVGLETAQLIIAIILVQLIAIPGAWLFARGSASLGNVNMLIIALMSWIAVCIFAFVVVDTPNEFFFAAGWIGFMMGGTQALSRSTYSKLLPETEDHTSFFSFYDVVEKIGIVIGMFSFGYIEGITGSMRNSVLSLIVFFTIGLLLLLWIPRQGRFTPQSSTST